MVLVLVLVLVLVGALTVVGARVAIPSCVPTHRGTKAWRATMGPRWNQKPALGSTGPLGMQRNFRRSKWNIDEAVVKHEDVHHNISTTFAKQARKHARILRAHACTQ